jgi:hypothetical protein
MVRRIGLVLVILFGLWAGLIVWLRAIGQVLPPSPTYLESGFCDQPCWQGLRPGVDNINQFLFRVRETTPYTGHTTDTGDGVARMFQLSTFGALTLADVIHEFGLPERVGCLGLDHTTLYPGQPLATSAYLYFGHGFIEVNAVRGDRVLRLSPDMQVRWVRYYAPGDEPVYPIGETTGWHGFASAGHYLECHP